MNDLDPNHQTVCSTLSQSKWTCILSTNQGKNEVIEGTTMGYIVRGDVGSGAGTSNSLEVSIGNLGTSPTDGGASGIGGTAGDVIWTDNATTAINWLDQIPSQVKPAVALFFGANSGTYNP